MSVSLIEFKGCLLEQLLNLLWRQWTAIGVPGYSQTEESRVVDPEALLLLSLTVARYDARLFDEILDWTEVNGDFLNVQRLQNLLDQYGFQARAELGAVAEILSGKSSSAPKWKKLASVKSKKIESSLFLMKDGRLVPTPGNCDEIFRRHGFLRPPLHKRRLAQPFAKQGMPSLLLRLRALFGINIRCEILCLLGAYDEIHPSLIARLMGLGTRSVQNALVDMARSGAVQVRCSAREKIYSLSPGALDSLLKPNGLTPWINSVPLFRALEILWTGSSDPKRQKLDLPTLASEWRRLSKEIKPLLGDAGMGQFLRDDSLFKGEAYYDAFVEDVEKILSIL